MACLLETPIRMSVLSEVTASSRHYVDRLFDPDPQKVLQGVIDMKNAVIGNNKQKANLIVLGAVPRLLYLLQQETSSTELKTECAVVLGSLAMGTENNVKSLLDCHIIPALLQGLLSPDLKFIEACLRCLRTIFTSPVTPEELLYTGPDHQTILFNHGAVQNIAHLLTSVSYKVRMQALKCFSVLAFENPQVSMTLVNVLVDGELLPQIFVKMLQRDKPIEMQLTSAKCLTYMCRAGAIRTDDNCIVLKTLPCLVRMCSKERLLEERVEGAETLAYLIEPDVELQRIASITDHLIAMLADYFKYPSSVSAITDIKRLDHDLKHAHELRQAAFKLYASLGANDEDIRKKIIETENMMDRIVTGLSESSVKVRLAAVRCLHSLSRSVQQLRTSFQDHAVWKPLMKVLQNAPDEILVVASSMLCNLLLEFSPSKEPILESGAVELLCGLTQSENPALRVNGIWALMNMAFQAEQKIKADILRSLSTEQLFRLLSDSDLNVLMKTLGLLRNLLSTRPHIDKIMSTHGKQIMQAVTLILEGEHNIEVKEQTLCILANIADGTTAKELIMTNDDILQKIKYYMGHSHVKLQLAAMFCISNLIWNEEEGSQERQDKLRDMGIVDILHKLSQSPDSNLCDKAKMALQQYLA
ncbi:armadillo repeat-containing protein 8 isoform X2 [Balaenoptera ricei]|uniref:Armadillo repeat-containing protein 8 n=11 Tax=Laurasiatheria TaxID=314145 RepID=A0A8C0Z6H7_CANLF|nr:PREDICTED: armadillo repeat-containing protein 8 isoform X2 [Odobenus rosmarus divergens]XP_007464415.1 PREDICTED: armadillo repeat-containing protein 8 isoform X3 [Lipotes vexillifer]XP_024606521.1 armadillo repeat-containing protein 8 isoform X2 [Neophocaena asiaeorientalis asiaeorientalis]XP_029069823.1 armadillo repeat-containing protein 8 isoform X3 [Monodon monoceros]XP_032485424.1 armadillo repeat-containing protein 8 isoform X2 [Phocoena sinus]XP_059776229.1 armadillo repeat-contain